MRNLLRSTARWLRAACCWPLVLLALPNCTFDFDAIGPQPFEFDPGPAPASSAIMCEIPVRDVERADNCASQDDIDNGISFSEAATALAEGRHFPVALDWREDSVAACSGNPQRTEFFGTFPDGLTVCLNCGTQIPAVYADPTKACIAKCKALLSADGSGTEISDYCEANTRTAVNYNKDICFDGACTNGGNADMAFFDPRRLQEKVAWVDLSGGILTFGDGSNGIQRTAPTTGTTDADFNEGAGSFQTITEGDAWVEFEALQTGVSHVIGLRESCEDVSACEDDDHGLSGIGFAVSLNSDNNVYVLEQQGSNPLEVFGPFGQYSPGERYRVRATDNHNGTATISYLRLTAACDAGTPCAEDLLHTHTGASPQYPLRIDAIFREENASLADVTLVRIKPR